MSRNDVPNNYGYEVRSTADRVLLLLKTRGPQTAAAVAERLGVTSEAVRQQLARLGEEGLVASHSVSQGVGRPSLSWDLTEAGGRRFPDAHAELAVQLLYSVRALLGEEALEALIAHREAETRRRYQARLKDLPLAGRMVALAALRSEEGFMAEAEPRGDGSWRLIENHCPIRAATEACPAFCRAERDLFEAVLGPGVRVTREAHILAGARHCAYEVALV